MPYGAHGEHYLYCGIYASGSIDGALQICCAFIHTKPLAAEHCSGEFMAIGHYSAVSL